MGSSWGIRRLVVVVSLTFRSPFSSASCHVSSVAPPPPRMDLMDLMDMMDTSVRVKNTFVAGHRAFVSIASCKDKDKDTRHPNRQPPTPTPTDEHLLVCNGRCGTRSLGRRSGRCRTTRAPSGASRSAAGGSSQAATIAPSR